MLNAAAMKDLLSANVDENASHFAFFSRHGTIMGHDHAADVKSIKRFAAFAANTWAHNAIALRERGRTVAPLTPGTSILRAVVRNDDDNDDGKGEGEGGKRLHCLIVRVGELVGAVTPVREGTLVAALKGRGEFVRGENEEVQEGVIGREGEFDSGEKGDGRFNDGGGGRGGEDGEDGTGKGKGKEEGGEKPAQWQILMWRSEGMGQYMADELGPKFKIPKGFY